MKKILIVTLYGNGNYGNKLQNYAVQLLCKKKGYDVLTVYDYEEKYNNFIKKIVKKILKKEIINNERYKNFKKFDKLIKKMSYKDISNKNKNIFVVGSDQIWNPKGKSSIRALKYLNKFDLSNSFSLSPSIAVKEIPNKYNKLYQKHFKSLKSISVREEESIKIIHNLSHRKDITILLDPTMLIDISKWDEVSIKPIQIDKLCPNGEKYILNYFLGNIIEERKNEIDRIAKDNNCKIINILDKNDPFYACGPSEFIWLEKNAFLICTDSFHSSVFAILYKRPFIVFNRDDGQPGINSMNSRLETLLSKFNLEDRYYNGKITNKLLNCDYKNVDKILKCEKEKTNNFLENSLK